MGFFLDADLIKRSPFMVEDTNKEKAARIVGGKWRVGTS